MREIFCYYTLLRFMATFPNSPIVIAILSLSLGGVVASKLASNYQAGGPDTKWGDELGCHTRRAYVWGFWSRCSQFLSADRIDCHSKIQTPTRKIDARGTLVS